MLSEWANLTMDGRRSILRDLVAGGRTFELRPFVDFEPDERIIVWHAAFTEDDGEIAELPDDAERW